MTHSFTQKKNAVDNDNNPVLCAININGKGNYNNIEIETNLIASVYGKDTNPVGFISKAVEDRLLYWNKKMSQDLFETNGLQLSDNLKQVDSNVIIRKSKYAVNPLSKNSSEKIKKVKERASLASENVTKSPTESEDIRFSLIDNYTEKQYNDFGWVRVNNVLSSRENANFRTKYVEIKRKTQANVHKTSKGEIIAPVNDMEKGKFGINNVLVFTKGTYENYKITRVIRLNSNSETHLEIVRGFIYEYEKDTNAQSRYTLEELYGEEIIEQYDSRDVNDYRTS